ncbi:MAG TPA: hypothetical protein VD813_00290 [Pseudonocardia sp.]|nr:hypothetical protein [Pseudonocardia sp.]
MPPTLVTELRPEPGTGRRDARTHHVPDAGPIADLPVRALCGREFVPAALITPPGRPCPACAQVVTRTRPAPRLRRRRSLARARLRRLARLRRRRAG